MSTYIQHATDWEFQRERLSAFLDGRLEAGDDAALRRHLTTCPRCSQEVAELRHVVALMRALPPPGLPRSFALPEGEPARHAPDVALVPPRAAPRWSRAAQWAGGLVAAAGLIIGIMGFAGGTPVQYAASRSLPSQQVTSTSARAGSVNTADRSSTPTGAASYGTFAPVAGATGTNAVVPVPTPTSGDSQRVPSTGPEPAHPLPALPITGAALLIAGATSFAAGTRSRRPRR